MLSRRQLLAMVATIPFMGVVGVSSPKKAVYTAFESELTGVQRFVGTDVTMQDRSLMLKMTRVEPSPILKGWDIQYAVEVKEG